MHASTDRLGKPLSDLEKLSRVRLGLSENVGPITFRSLLNRFGSAETALNALPDLARRGGSRRPIRICPKGDAERELEKAQAFGAGILCYGEPDYPLYLAAVEDAPPFLFMKGHTHLLGKTSVAIVGARNAGAAGLKMAGNIAAGLAAAKVVVVSGLARGIDASAHTAALAGGTIAVLGGGLDIHYPKQNHDLQERIAAEGLLVTEAVFGTRPQARHFPRRNRIISGLVQAVVVVEAARRSGSLITARLAGEQGREVFAVPGSPLDARAEGSNHLIREGATLVRHADDVLEGLPRHFSTPAQEPESTLFNYREMAREPAADNPENRQLVFNLLSITPISLDELVRSSELTAAEVLTILLELELAGLAERHPGGTVSRSIEADQS